MKDEIRTHLNDPRQLDLATFGWTVGKEKMLNLTIMSQRKKFEKSFLKKNLLIYPAFKVHV